MSEPDLIELVAELQVRVAELESWRAIVEAPRQPKLFRNLLRAIAADQADAEWTTANLLEAADDKTPSAPALKAALDEIVAHSSCPARTLGRFLSSYAGRCADDLQLVRVIARTRDGALYQVRFRD